MAKNGEQLPVGSRPIESTTMSSTFTGAPGGVKIGQLTSTAGGGTFVVGVYAQAVDGGVQFWVQVESGSGDLRGFFLDVGAPGGAITSAGNGNNMNGTGFSFDYGVEIGTPGSSDVITKATFTLNDLPMMDLSALLDGATFGIRATDVGTGSTSVKLVGTAELPEVTVSIAPDGDVLENAPAAFTISLSMPVDEDMLVTLSNGATVTIPKGSTSVSYVDGTQGDDVYIDPGQVSVSIASAVPQGPTLVSVIIDTDPAVVNVTDTIDPVTVGIYIAGGERDPGDPMIFRITIDQPLDSPLQVALSTGDTITIPAGSTEYFYTVEDPPLSITVEIDSAVVTGKTFESLVISPDSATITDPPPPPDEENFPTLENNISHITIYFSAAAGSGLEAFDTKGGSSSGGQSGPDGLYTVKIDWLDADTDYRDLDDVWDTIYARLLEVDPNLIGKAVLGVAIKAGSGEQFYALDGDEDVDPVPLRNVDGSPSSALVIAAATDRVYTSDADADGRNDFFEPAGGYLLSGMINAEESAPV